MPAPTTTGGGLMGYASTVDTGLVAPIALIGDGSISLTSTLAVTAGAAYFTAFVLYGPVTVAQMRCAVSTGSPTGNIDLGIYDATGTNNKPNNLLAHIGATAATTGVFTQNLTANLPLAPGLYWLAGMCTVGNTFIGRSLANAGMVPNYITSATNLTVLPATAGTVNTTASLLSLEGLLLNSYA